MCLKETGGQSLTYSNAVVLRVALLRTADVLALKLEYPQI